MCCEAPYRAGEEELLLYAIMSWKKINIKKLISIELWQHGITIPNMAMNYILDKKATEKRNKLSIYSIVKFKHF